MARGRREPDALDLWFARQRNLWWKKWRWAVYAGLVVLLYIMLVHMGFHAYLLWDASFGQAQLWSHFSDVLRWSARILLYLTYGLLALALLFGTMLAKAAIPPPELALTTQTGFLFAALNSFVRKQLWNYVAVFWVLPGILSAVLLAVTFTCRPTSAQPTPWQSLLGMSLGVIATAVLATEAQALVLRRSVNSRGLSYGLILPFGAIALLAAGWDYAADLLIRWNLGLWLDSGIWISAGLSALELGAGIALAYAWRSPPPGFTGAAEA